LSYKINRGRDKQHGHYSEYHTVCLKDDKKIHLKHPHHIKKYLTIYMVMDITRLTVVIIYQYTQIYKHYVVHSKQYNVMSIISIKNF